MGTAAEETEILFLEQNQKVNMHDMVIYKISLTSIHREKKNE